MQLWILLRVLMMHPQMIICVYTGNTNPQKRSIEIIDRACPCPSMRNRANHHVHRSSSESES